MMRSGHVSKPKSVTTWTSVPSVMEPVETRHEPTASITTMASDGSAWSAGSNVARRSPDSMRASRSCSARARNLAVSAGSRPSVFTINAPSTDS